MKIVKLKLREGFVKTISVEITVKVPNCFHKHKICVKVYTPNFHGFRFSVHRMEAAQSIIVMVRSLSIGPSPLRDPNPRL